MNLMPSDAPSSVKPLIRKHSSTTYGNTEEKYITYTQPIPINIINNQHRIYIHIHDSNTNSEYLAGRFDALVHGQTDDDPSGQQTSSDDEVELSGFVDGIGDIQSFTVPEICCGRAGGTFPHCEWKEE